MPKDAARSCSHGGIAKGEEIQPISYVVPMLIPEGVTILAGKPKIGKSWWALDLGN